MDDETELALRAELEQTRERLHQAQRDLFDCRARLALIVRVCQDAARSGFPVRVLLAVVRAAVFNDPSHVRLPHRHLAGR